MLKSPSLGLREGHKEGGGVKMFKKKSKEKKVRNILLKRQSARSRNAVFFGVTNHGVQGWGHIRAWFLEEYEENKFLLKHQSARKAETCE